MRSEEQLAKAAEGAAYVFHVASPFVITAEDPQRDIVDPAVEGTTAVLKAVAQHKDGVKRVVVTSSVCGEGEGRGDVWGEGAAPTPPAMCYRPMTLT